MEYVIYGNNTSTNKPYFKYFICLVFIIYNAVAIFKVYVEAIE